MTATVAGIHLGIDVHASRPAANTVPDGSLYSCSDHKLIYKSNYAGNSWATWATLPSAGAGGIATDTIWAAAGDLAVASGNDTAAVLSLGAVGSVLGRINGAVAWNGGTSFPGSKATSDRFYRSDLAMEFYWDGTRWLTTGGLATTIESTNGALPITATTNGTHRGAPPNELGGSDIYLTSVRCSFNVSGGTALSGSHKWIGTVSKVAGVTANTIATVTIDSGSSSTWRISDVAIGALLANGTPQQQIVVDWAKTGTPGNLFAMFRLNYRIVAT